MTSQVRARTTATDATRCNSAADSASSTLDALKAFLHCHRVARKFVPGEFEAFEKALHERVMGLERDLLRDEIAAADIESEAIVVESKTPRRVLKSSQTFMTAAGAVVVERWLYKDRTDEESRAVSPLESRLGIVDFSTPGNSEAMFQRIGTMTAV